MSFAPPPGPPPPSVPDGWKAQYDDRYKQWFFVNLQTGKSQWEQPEAPAQKQEELHEPPSGPPPSYEDSIPADPSAVPNTSEKKALGSNNPYNQSGTNEDTVESDARLAARLQAEENARTSTQSPAAAQPGAATDYYNDTSQPHPQGLSPGQSPAPQNTSRGTRDRSRSFLSKLIGKKTSGSSSSSNAGYGYGYSRPPPAPPQQPAYGYPPVGYQGGYSQPGYGYPQYPMGGGGGYYPSRPQRQVGMGNAGAAALGVGGGLLGGAMLANAFGDHGDTYVENNYDGDGGDYGGSDYGGDDYGGGDDFGGGDFGGDF